MKKRTVVVFLAAAVCCALAGCGDDLETVVPTVNPVFPLETGGQSEKSEQKMPEDAAEQDNTKEQGSTEAQDGAEKQDGTEETDGAAASGEDSTEPEPEEVHITISAAGDVTLGNYFGQDYAWSFREMWGKQQNPAYFLENVYDIFSSDDMTIVNLEGPLTNAEDRKEEQTYCISGDPEYADVLTEGSVEAVSMANNHRLDYYEQGTADTVEAVSSRGISYAYDKNLGIYETKGIVIGFVSVNEVGQGAGVEKILKEGIALLREQGADLVLANCHWGIERENYPEEYQLSLGRKCIDWGADLVLGHHPHVLQGIEEYQGKYIVYSLGNFCFGANRNPKDKDCIIFQQTFTFRGRTLQEGTEARIIPCSVSSVSNRNDYRPTPAEGEDAQRIIERMNEYSADFGVYIDEDGNL